MEDVFPVHDQILGSYSRSEAGPGETAKVYVPGYPPLLRRTEIYKSFRLGRDGVRSVDDSSQVQDDLLLSTTMKDLFRAVQLCSPGFDFKDVDIVTDRYVLHKLLRFCGSPGNT